MQSQQQQTTVDASLGDGAIAQEAAKSIVSGYANGAGRYDELLTDAGQPRASWHQFLRLLGHVSPAEFSRRWEHSQRLIYENGISYSAYGVPETSARPWDLDALPLLIQESEWEQVSAGVAQRAQLLRMVLADLYGPQRLIQEGVLPIELLYGHEGHRLAFHSLDVDPEMLLPFYATDLGRDTQGRWWVLADRTEAPSGIGFALENRVVISRMLPEVFRGCNVHRLAPFFIAVKSMLQRMAPQAQENPRVVIYTRGPSHDNYFEDAYLARYLGYNLVEGGDLCVRDNKVWLKTLDGLLQIDVLLRRPNSELCDALEFPDDTVSGIVGLVHSVRRKQVGVANPLGSGLVESPAFMAFMPRLCKFMMSQELLMPGIATWWCGEKESLDRVLSNPESYVISPAYRVRGGGHSQATARLSQLSTEELCQRIQANPTEFVAQERLPLSTVPRWQEGAATQANLVLRSFALSGSDDSYTVMPGGLARTSDASSASASVIPASQGSKDAWVLSSKPVEYVSLMDQHDETIVLRRTGADLPSRVADNIFWLGRHIERADAAAKLLRTFVLRLTSENSVNSEKTSTILLRALASQGQIEPGFALDEIRQPMPAIDTALPLQVFDRSQSGSLRVMLDMMFRTASQVRDRLSPDSWRVLVRIDQQFRASEGVDLTDLLRMLNGLIVDLAAIEGICMESMTRSHVFRFLDLGRRLERALQMIGLLQSCLIDAPAAGGDLLDSLLEVADSEMTYRSRYMAKIQLPAVLDLLLTDESNPRSIAYQLTTLQSQIDRLPSENHPAGYWPHERLILSMVHSVRMLDVFSISEDYYANQNKRLDDLLDSMDRDLQGLSQELSNRYLVHTSQSRRIESATSEE